MHLSPFSFPFVTPIRLLKGAFYFLFLVLIYLTAQVKKGDVFFSSSFSPTLSGLYICGCMCVYLPPPPRNYSCSLELRNTNFIEQTFACQPVRLSALSLCEFRAVQEVLGSQAWQKLITLDVHQNEMSRKQQRCCGKYRRGLIKSDWQDQGWPVEGGFEPALATTSYIHSWEEEMFLFAKVCIWLLT